MQVVHNLTFWVQQYQLQCSLLLPDHIIIHGRVHVKDVVHEESLSLMIYMDQVRYKHVHAFSTCVPTTMNTESLEMICSIGFTLGFNFKQKK